MKTFLLTLLALCMTGALSAQPRHVETIIALHNENGDLASVRFGLDSAATNGLDNGLEFAVPGFPPAPMKLQAYLNFKDGNLGVLSYADFRPFPSTKSFVDTFNLLITPSSDDSRGSKIYFQWAWPVEPNIDSIVISDGLGGVVKRFRCDKREYDTLSGNAKNLEQFMIIVYYNVKTTGVEPDENVTNAQTIVCESGVADLRVLGSQTQLDRIELFDVRATKVADSGFNSLLDMRNLSPGLYLARLYNVQHELQKTLRILR